MHEVQHEVVLHGDVESLQLFSAGATSGNSSVYCVLRLNELFVLAVDFVYNSLSVDARFIALPVDGLAFVGR